jgi:hypothetical protein
VAFTATGDTLVPRLEARDSEIALWVVAGGEEVLVDPSWTPGPGLAVARQMHTATKPDGSA